MILTLLLDVMLHFNCCNDEMRGQSDVPAALLLRQKYHGIQSISEWIGPTTYLDATRHSDCITNRIPVLHWSCPQTSQYSDRVKWFT